MPSPELQQILNLFASRPVASYPENVEKWRAETEAKLTGPLAPSIEEQIGSLGDIPVRWLRPTDSDPTHGVLYLHGGAYCVGSSSAYRSFASRVAALLNARVAVIDYRLAPEHPFPAAVVDALDAYHHIIEIGIAPDRLAVLGDSAGGGLTAALLVALAQKGRPQPAAAVAISAFCDLTVGTDGYRRCSETDPFITEDMLSRAAGWYLAGQDPRLPLASPRFAAPDHLAQIAPLLLQVGESEFLADDSAVLAEHIVAAGGDVTLELWPEVVHVWHLMGDGVPEARDGMLRIREFILDHWT